MLLRVTLVVEGSVFCILPPISHDPYPSHGFLLLETAQTTTASGQVQYIVTNREKLGGFLPTRNPAKARRKTGAVAMAVSGSE